MRELAKATAIVTGGASGIGKAIASLLIAEGANVVIASRRKDLLTLVQNELNQRGPGKALGVTCNVTERTSVELAANTAIAQFGSIDIMVNNSGIGVQYNVVDLPEAEWDRVIDTNLKGTFLMTQAVLPTMIKQRSGVILNIASQAAKHGYSQAAPYCASKYGILGFAESLQHEVREYGIRVHSLCPGLVQVPSPESSSEIRKDVLQVEDLARVALFVLKQPPHVKLEDIGLFHL